MDIVRVASAMMYWCLPSIREMNARSHSSRTAPSWAKAVKAASGEILGWDNVVGAYWVSVTEAAEK
jgi:hypothetical protein